MDSNPQKSRELELELYLNLTQHGNTDAGDKHLYIRVNIIKANYKKTIMLYNFLRSASNTNQIGGKIKTNEAALV